MLFRGLTLEGSYRTGSALTVPSAVLRKCIGFVDLKSDLSYVSAHRQLVLKVAFSFVAKELQN